jgi:hypothetical protein
MAATEQSNKGQIGQPAACMIENNPCLSRRSVFGTRDYGPGSRLRAARLPCYPALSSVQISQFTLLVDNFVGKLLAIRATARNETDCGALHKS